MSASPSRPTHQCTGCGHAFTPESMSGGRCPQCMRGTGIVRRADAKNGGSGGNTWVLVVGVLVVLTVIGMTWYALTADAFFATEDTPGTAGIDPELGLATATEGSGPASVLAGLDADLRVRTDAVDAAVTAYAATLLPEGADISKMTRGLATAVAGLQADGTLPDRGVDADLWEAPRSAGILCAALQAAGATDGTVPAAGTFERATLLGALMAAKDLAPNYGIDPTAPGGATDPQRTRYLVRAGEGPWLDPTTGKVVDGDKTTPIEALSDTRFMAHTLAWRSLAAVAAVDSDGASRFSAAAVRLAPKDPVPAFVAGTAQLAGGLVDIGLETMQAAAALRSDARTWYQIGTAAMQVGQPFKARQFLMKSAAMDAKFGAPHVMLAQLAFDRLEVTPKTEHGSALKRISEHLDRASAADPLALGIRSMKAQLAVRAGEADAARALLEEEVELHPSDGQSWIVLAGFLEAVGENAEALATVKRAEERGIEGSELSQMAGALMARGGDLEGAAKRLQRALELDPTERSLRPQIAQLAQALNDTEGARAVLTEQVERFADDMDSALLLVQLEMVSGDLDRAHTLIMAIIGDHPEHGDAAVLRYLVALQRSDEAELATARDAAIIAAKKRSVLAQIMLEQGAPDEAELLLKAAIQTDPTDDMAPVMLATLYAITDRLPMAEALRDELVAAAPEDARAILKDRFDTAFKEIAAARESGDLPANGKGGE